VIEATAVPLGGEHPFLAYVFRAEAGPSGRVWVCVRSRGASAEAGWLGCWSSKQPAVSLDELKQFLTALSEKVATGGRTGPFGPYLDDHYFFPGWDLWGGGLPAPLIHRPPAEIAANAAEVSSIAELQSFVVSTGEA
jgi:hypothetical protein